MRPRPLRGPGWRKGGDHGRKGFLMSISSDTTKNNRRSFHNRTDGMKTLKRQQAAGVSAFRA